MILHCDESKIKANRIIKPIFSFIKYLTASKVVQILTQPLRLFKSNLNLVSKVVHISSLGVGPKPG